uniref:Uncharacterized protein n=1 Tax=Leersia perrieri TaxID=77586 RepID=A0A0D9XR65_9ORYZ
MSGEKVQMHRTWAAAEDQVVPLKGSSADGDRPGAAGEEDSLKRRSGSKRKAEEEPVVEEAPPADVLPVGDLPAAATTEAAATGAVETAEPMLAASGDSAANWTMNPHLYPPEYPDGIPMEEYYNRRDPGDLVVDEYSDYDDDDDDEDIEMIMVTHNIFLFQLIFIAENTFCICSDYSAPGMIMKVFMEQQYHWK